MVLAGCVDYRKLNKITKVNPEPMMSTQWQEIPAQDRFDQRILADNGCSRGVQNSVCDFRRKIMSFY